MKKQIPIDDKIIQFINKFPNKFSIILGYSGFFSALVYRAIAASDDKFVWKDYFCGVDTENLKPLEWPRKTEGFLTYTIDNNKPNFRENHATTVHLGQWVLNKYTDINHLVEDSEKNKILLFRTHELDLYKKLHNVKTVRIYGDIKKIINPKKSGFRDRRPITSVEYENVHNLCIDKFMSDNYDDYFEEYFNLCKFYDMMLNANNVRAFILLHKERLQRWSLSL